MHALISLCAVRFSHLSLCSVGAHALGSALLSPGSGFNKWNNENQRWNHPPSRALGWEKIHCHGNGIQSLPTSFSIALWKCHHFPLSPIPSWPPQASLPSALKSSQWPHGFWLGRGHCDITKGPALAGPQYPGARTDQHTRSHFLSAHHAVLQVVPVLFHGC